MASKNGTHISRGMENNREQNAYNKHLTFSVFLLCVHHANWHTHIHIPVGDLFLAV